MALHQDRDAGLLLHAEVVGLLHDLAVVEERRGIDELVGARQRRTDPSRVEGEGARRLAGIQGLVFGLQRRFDLGPALDGGLQGRRAARRHRTG
ncbi:hypothetical protein D3C78_1490280 [compost metagenome]